MLSRIITWSLGHGWIVIASALGLVGIGAWALSRLDIDAFPDTTPVQVQVNTVAPALGPEEIERRITAPIERSVFGLPGLEQLRSVSKFGFSQVVVTFVDGTDVYRARQLLSERLSSVELKEGVERPRMGPTATGLGEVFHYLVTGPSEDATWLRTVQDSILKPILQKAPGVAEINSWGGFERQYHVRLDPVRLAARSITLEDAVEALSAGSASAGGGSIDHAWSMLIVQGNGRVTNLEEIRGIVVATRHGVPVRVGEVAEVAIGHEIRRGAVTADGRGEAVLGLGFTLMGENSREVAARLQHALDSTQVNLPEGVHAETVYARTELVDHVIDTVRKNLFGGGLLVVAVLFMFLGSLRAGLIVALAIPFSMLLACSGMLHFAIAGSLMSLGAIDFGLVVDSSVILVENAVRHLADPANAGRSRIDVVRDAAIEVRKPTLFGELIIMIVYLPILALEGVEGKLFRPMALTVIFALLGSMLISLTLMPVLASWLLPRASGEAPPLLLRLLTALYRPLLRLALRHRLAVLGLACGWLAITVMLARGLGAEFVPRLSEGAIAINVVRLAGTSLEESVRYNTFMEKAILRAFPDEVEHVWSRIGAAEIATDPMGVELTDIFVTLKPRRSWKRARDQAELTVLLRKELGDFPGQRNGFSQPIEMRVNEMIAGVRSEIAVKVFGDDLEVLEAKAKEIAAVLGSVDGAVDVGAEQVTGQPVLEIRLLQEQLARHGVSARRVMGFVEALGGRLVGEVIEGQLSYPLVVRLPEHVRQNPERVAAMLVEAPSGERVFLSQLADLRVIDRPSTITREWGQRRITIEANVRGRDISGFVAEAREKVARAVTLPQGRYRIEWGGQFESLERARRRLWWIVPIALGLILLLLYGTYNRMLDALRVFTGVPFAAAGGVTALWLCDLPFSISAAVGFIALSGVSVLADMVLVSRVRQLLRLGLSLRESVEQAAITRLRPVIVTSLVASLGFLPMAISTGVGAEVQRPLATVVVGGVISSTVLTLLVLPVIYMLSGSRLGAAIRK